MQLKETSNRITFQRLEILSLHLLLNFCPKFPARLQLSRCFRCEGGKKKLCPKHKSKTKIAQGIYAVAGAGW